MYYIDSYFNIPQSLKTLNVQEVFTNRGLELEFTISSQGTWQDTDKKGQPYYHIEDVLLSPDSIESLHDLLGKYLERNQVRSQIENEKEAHGILTK